jgi:hypothetical protein
MTLFRHFVTSSHSSCPYPCFVLTSSHSNTIFSSSSLSRFLKKKKHFGQTFSSQIWIGCFWLAGNSCDQPPHILKRIFLILPRFLSPIVLIQSCSKIAILEGKFVGGVEVFAAALVQGFVDAEKGENHVDYFCVQGIGFVDAVEQADGGETRKDGLGAGEEVLEDDFFNTVVEATEDIFGIHRVDCGSREGLRSACGRRESL